MWHKPKTLLLLGALAAVVDGALLYLGLPLHSLDCKLYYSAEKAYQVLEMQGEAGRELYFKTECLDLCFIVIYFLFSIGIIRYFQSKQAPTLISKLAIVSISCMAIADVIETSGILILLGQYPDKNMPLADLVSVCTPLKWVSLASLLLFLYRLWQNLPED